MINGQQREKRGSEDEEDDCEEAIQPGIKLKPVRDAAASYFQRQRRINGLSMQA